ncbi:hypothetical protein EJB05_03009, partial [Eragrostis curvula]
MYRPAGRATKATKRTKAKKETRIWAVNAGDLASARRNQEVTSVMSDAVSAMRPRSVLSRSRSDSASAMTGNDDSDSLTASSVISDVPLRSSGSDGCSAWNTGSVTARGTTAPVRPTATARPLGRRSRLKSVFTPMEKRNRIKATSEMLSRM